MNLFFEMDIPLAGDDNLVRISVYYWAGMASSQYVSDITSEMLGARGPHRQARCEASPASGRSLSYYNKREEETEKIEKKYFLKTRTERLNA